MKTTYIVVVHGFGTSKTKFTSITKALGFISMLAKAGKHVEIYTKAS